MERAQPAILRAARGVGELRVFKAPVVAELELFHLEIESGIGIDLVPKLAVLHTGFFHVNRAILFEQPRLDHLQAFRADRLRGLGQAFL